MARNLPKNEEFLKVIELAFLEFENEYNVTASEYFANKLQLSTQNQISNKFQPYSPTGFNIDELLLILKHLGTSKKLILDYLCEKNNYVCSKKANHDTKTTKEENIKDSLINISSSNGSIFSNFVNYYSDGELDNNEIDELLKLSYIARVELISFENSLKEILKDRGVEDASK